MIFNTIIAGGLYFQEEILSDLPIAGLIGFILMIIPLALGKFSNRATGISIGIILYPIFPIFIIIGGACPPYGVYPFMFFGAVAALLSFVYCIKVKGLDSFVYYIPLAGVILLMFVMGSRVPRDIYKAIDRSLKTEKEYFDEQYKK